MAFEVQESEGLKIEWDVPVPARPFITARVQNEGLWTKRLNPFRQHPGRRARILVLPGKVPVKSKNTVDNIKRALERHDPYEIWKLERFRNDEGDYEIFCTYEGKMSEAEYLKKMRLREQRGDVIRQGRLKNQLKKEKALARSMLSGSLRPPTV